MENRYQGTVPVPYWNDVKAALRALQCTHQQPTCAALESCIKARRGVDYDGVMLTNVLDHAITTGKLVLAEGAIRRGFKTIKRPRKELQKKLKVGERAAAEAGPKTESKADVRIWAQCEKCSVWRRMAVGVKQWDGDFECSMNNWDRYNECGMPEEEMGEDESEDDADTKRKKNTSNSRVSPKKRQKVGGKDSDTKKAVPRKKKRKRAARVWVRVTPQSVSTRYILPYWSQQ